MGLPLPAVMLAIAGAESGWRNDSAGDSFVDSPHKCNGYASWGLWQINMAAHYPTLRRLTGSDSPCVWANWLSVPENNARMANLLIGEAPNLAPSALRPWTVWWSPDGNPRNDAGDGNGMWRQHLDAAVSAIWEYIPKEVPALPPQAGSIAGVVVVGAIAGVVVGRMKKSGR